MTDRTALFANVLGAPADDTARLVLADWLEEHGEENLGRFLRAGVLAARYHAQDRLDDPAYYDELRTIADVTLGGAPARWLSDLGVGPTPLTHGDWVWDDAVDRVTVRIGAAAGVFTRGLLSELVVPLDGWYDLAARALAGWPLERATITDVPGLSFWIDPPAADRSGWRLSAAFTVQPRRRRHLLHRLRAVLGTGESDPSPVPVGRWSAERTFPDRATLVRSARDVWPALFDEVRDAAGARWAPAPRGGT